MTRPIFRPAILAGAALAALSLAACGGGGAPSQTAAAPVRVDPGAVPPPPEPDPAPSQRPAPASATHDGVLAALSAIEDASEPSTAPAPAAPPPPPPDPGADVVSNLESIVARSNVSLSSHGQYRTHTPGEVEFLRTHLQSAAEAAALPARNGVSLTHREHNRGLNDYHSVTGWLEHSMFQFSLERSASAIPFDSSISFRSWYYSLGAATGANPTGAFTWTGAAVAVGADLTPPTHNGHLFFGDATVRIDDGADPNLYFSVTGLTRADGAETLRDIRLSWAQAEAERRVVDREGFVPQDMVTNGRFSIHGQGRYATPENDMGDSVEGQFYGPNTEEVGGTFRANNYSESNSLFYGVFGAKR